LYLINIKVIRKGRRKRENINPAFKGFFVFWWDWVLNSGLYPPSNGECTGDNHQLLLQAQAQGNDDCSLSFAWGSPPARPPFLPRLLLVPVAGASSAWLSERGWGELVLSACAPSEARGRKANPEWLMWAFPFDFRNCCNQVQATPWLGFSRPLSPDFSGRLHFQHTWRALQHNGVPQALRAVVAAGNLYRGSPPLPISPAEPQSSLWLDWWMSRVLLWANHCG
jgi:hypothetical protein